MTPHARCEALPVDADTTLNLYLNTMSAYPSPIKKRGGTERNTEIVSLFSGAMGLDLGLHAEGFKTKVCVELNADCQRTIRANYPEAAVFGDLKALLKEDPRLDSVRQHLSFRRPFAVVGGPPCQSFSTAGKRRGLGDLRGTLVLDFIKAVEVLNPYCFVMENVKGLLQHVIETDEGSPKLADYIVQQFEGLGYKTRYWVVNAADYGSAQTRERVVFMGSKSGYLDALEAVNEKATWVPIKDVIRDLEEDPGDCAAFSAKLMSFLQFVPEGGNWRALNDGQRRIALGGAYSSGGGKVGFYRRLSWEKPAPTLVTSPIQKATLLCHPSKLRPLSVREYARIQGYPDNWVFKGGLMSRYKQIGNSVPLALARAIARCLAKKHNLSACVDKKTEQLMLNVA